MNYFSYVFKPALPLPLEKGCNKIYLVLSSPCDIIFYYKMYFFTPLILNASISRLFVDETPFKDNGDVFILKFLAQEKL